MDYSFLMGIHNIDLDISDNDLNDHCNFFNVDDNSKKKTLAKIKAWKSLKLNFDKLEKPFEFVFIYLINKNNLH